MNKFNDVCLNKNFYTLREYLFSIKDENYRKFSLKLIPNYPNIIGVRVPILKNIVKNMKNIEYKSYLNEMEKLYRNNQALYHEERLVYGYIIGQLQENFFEKLKRIEFFIKFIDNWAICDSLGSSFKFLKEDKENFLIFLEAKLKTDNIWEQRFILVSLLEFYVESRYLKKIFSIVEEIKTEDYYVKMAKAWLISVCYVKFEKETEKFLLKTELDKWTINKSIQKIRESQKINKEKKDKVLKYKR